ncbi:MAG: energy-coupling factor transporter transmembrane component T [candidate division WOR-3 bacterium]
MYLYVEKKEFFHSLHPVTKIFLLLAYLSVSIIFNSPIYLGLFLLLALAIIISAGGMENIRRMGFVLIFLFCFSTILWAFFIKEGKVLFKIGALTITDKSIVYGLGMGMRLDLMVVSGLLFFSITMIEEFTYGLFRLGLPFSFCFALSMAFRFVPIFLKEGTIVAEAQTLRGLDRTSGNILRRIRNYFPLIIPIFITTIKGMDNLFLALESKGFKPQRGRTFYLERSPEFIDYSIIVFLILLVILCLFLRIRGCGFVLNRL